MDLHCICLCITISQKYSSLNAQGIRELKKKNYWKFCVLQIGKFHLLFGKIQAIFSNGNGAEIRPPKQPFKIPDKVCPSTVMVHGVFLALWYKSIIMMRRHNLRISTTSSNWTELGSHGFPTLNQWCRNSSDLSDNRTIGHFFWMSDKKCWSAGPNVRQKL